MMASGGGGPSMAVVIPSFQQGRFIGETLGSVLSQGLEGLEVFVADGGSTDETLEVLRAHADRGCASSRSATGGRRTR